jgi:putative membrane protein
MIQLVDIKMRAITHMKKISLGILALVVASLVSMSTYAWGCVYGPGMTGVRFGGFLGPVVMLFFLALVIIGIVYTIRHISGHPRGSRAESPLDIVRMRYAKGEIGKDEFEKIKEGLSNS